MLPERNQIVKDTFAKALSLVDKVERSAEAEDKEDYSLLLWKAAAEAEYLAFQTSMIHGLSDSDLRGTDGGNELSAEAARKLLKAAQLAFQSNPSAAYISIRGAVHVLRKMYAASEKSAPIRSPKIE